MNLADFYKKENIHIVSEDIIKRQKSIDRYSKSLSTEKIKELILCYLGVDVIKNSEVLTAELHKDDAAFSSYSNEREISIIATYIIFSEHESDDVLHLSTLTSSLNGITIGSVAPELIDKLKKNLKTKSIKERNDALFELFPAIYPSKKLALIAPPKESQEDDPKPTLEDIPNIIERLQKSIEEQQFYFKETYSILNDSLEKLQKQHQFSKEESNILWWLTNGHSNIFNAKMSDLEIEKSFISGAFELGNLITSTFGPSTALNIISRAALCGRSDSNTNSNFGSLVEKTADGISSSFNQDSIKTNKILFPVIYAMLKKDESGAGETWKIKYEKDMNIDTNIELNARDFSNLIYHEILLSKIIN